ncbi:MAG: xanthine dehydrogenase family protein molybdopterin-binding subunit [Ferruginibacter sp.]
MRDSNTINRRGFLKTGAALGSGLVIGFILPAKAGRIKNLLQTTTAPTVFSPNAFLQISTDNSIKLILAHVEMGQGIWTTLSMLVAEELDADWKQINIEHAPPGKPYFHTQWPMQITGGSSTTYSEFDRYRQAGATARILLVQAAANKWGVQPSACKTANGFVTSGDKKLSYGELAESAATLTPPAEIPLRKKEEWKYIGKGLKRLDAPAKVNGKAIFGMDIQMEGLLIAAVAHSPVMAGTVKSFDASETKKIKGVVDVVQIPTGVAVIAENYWVALQGKKALKIEWEPGANASLNTPQQIEDYKKLAATKGKEIVKQGDVDGVTSKAAKTMEVEYVLPYLAHAAMEPLNCTVKIGTDKCEIWTGTQLPFGDQAAAATILGLKPEQVSVTVPFLGGAFGRRATMTSDFVSEAVHIAKASGKTIKMIWSREDDMQGGYYRPLFVHHIKAGIDDRGMPLFLDHTIVGQNLPGDTGGAATEGISDSGYLKSIPNHLITLHSPELPVTTLWLRSVGHTHTAFAMECCIDEMAHLAGKDPVAYRRTLLKGHERHLGVLNLAAEKAGWGKPLPKGHFHGIAVHESFKSFVAQVAEVSVDNNGKVKVHKVTAAVDCGLAVNPDGVRMQIESCVNYALSMLLYGEVSFKDGVVQETNFHTYKILRMYEAPAVIDVHIADSGGEMGGVGEPGFPPTAPAVANAVFAATGKRIRQLPFGSKNLKA